MASDVTCTTALAPWLQVAAARAYDLRMCFKTSTSLKVSVYSRFVMS
jgi:hypothetical protein